MFQFFFGKPSFKNINAISVDFMVNDEVQTSLVNYNTDIAETEQFSNYVQSINYLFPLRFAASIAKQEISTINKFAIKDVNVNDVLWLNLRFFDGKDRIWFDSLKLPQQDKLYAVSTVVKRFSSKSKFKIVIFAAAFNQEYILTAYDILSCTFSNQIFLSHPSSFISVTKELCTEYPQLLI